LKVLGANPKREKSRISRGKNVYCPLDKTEKTSGNSKKKIARWRGEWRGRTVMSRPTFECRKNEKTKCGENCTEKSVS